MKLPLFNYQASAADLMATRSRFGLHDEMGIGKTATTIGAIDRAGARRGVVVCPAMLRENWIKEFRQFSIYDRRICKGETIHDYYAWSRGLFDILITSYEQATKWAGNFHKDGEYFDFLAMDEAHKLKNMNSNRATAILGPQASGDNSVVMYADKAWHITGTLMPNDPMDAYTFLRFSGAFDVGPEVFVKTFFHRTLGAYGAKHTPRPEMLSTLQQLIFNNSIRRTHSMVGMELPDIFLTEVLVESKDIDLKRAVENYPNMEKAIVHAIESGDMKSLDATHIAIVRRLVGKAKAVAYAEMLKDELDGGAGKRVVFCWHTEPLLYVKKYLEKHGYKVVTVYGGTPEHEAQENVRLFREDPETVVFVGNIVKAGTGLTLVESCEIDMLESDWSPAGNAQAIKRVHRYGQKNAVRGRFITLANSIDVVVNRVVAQKTAAIAEIEGHTMAAAPLDVTRHQR